MAVKAKKPVDFKNSRHSKYPWDEWLDGDQWILTPGKDFTTTSEAFSSAMWRASKVRGLRSKTMVQDGKLYLQAFPLDEEE